MELKYLMSEIDPSFTLIQGGRCVVEAIKRPISESNGGILLVDFTCDYRGCDLFKAAVPIKVDQERFEDEQIEGIKTRNCGKRKLRQGKRMLIRRLI